MSVRTENRFHATLKTNQSLTISEIEALVEGNGSSATITSIDDKEYQVYSETNNPEKLAKAIASICSKQIEFEVIPDGFPAYGYRCIPGGEIELLELTSNRSIVSISVITLFGGVIDSVIVFRTSNPDHKNETIKAAEELFMTRVKEWTKNRPLTDEEYENVLNSGNYDTENGKEVYLIWNEELINGKRKKDES